MQADRASGTAFGVALHRAAHQMIEGGRIFADPLAVPIVGRHGELMARQMGNFPATEGWRTFICARAQFAETCLRAAVEQKGVGQLVVLGAGLDTFAYRNPWEGRLTVFEVDHPSSQLWKRRCLEQASIAVPPSVRYASVDLAQDDLFAQLEKVGFDRTATTFVTCLGLFYYLTKDTIRTILAGVAEIGGSIVFDYSDPPESLAPFQQDALAEQQRQLSANGEPYVSFFDPAELHAMLGALGFTALDDLDNQAWMTRYGGDRMLEAWCGLTGQPDRGAHMMFATAGSNGLPGGKSLPSTCTAAPGNPEEEDQALLMSRDAESDRDVPLSVFCFEEELFPECR
jgi:methyltransferase (TIGR00027 family)